MHMNIPDHSYLSRFDCFHPSLFTHGQIAMGLVNNMQQPIGKKNTKFDTPVHLDCPSGDAPIPV